MLLELKCHSLAGFSALKNATTALHFHEFPSIQSPLLAIAQTPRASTSDVTDLPFVPQS